MRQRPPIDLLVDTILQIGLAVPGKLERDPGVGSMQAQEPNEEMRLYVVALEDVRVNLLYDRSQLLEGSCVETLPFLQYMHREGRRHAPPWRMRSWDPAET